MRPLDELNLAYQTYVQSKTRNGSVKAEAVMDFHDAMLRCHDRLFEQHRKTDRELRLLRPERCRDVSRALERHGRLVRKREALQRDAESWNAMLRHFKGSPAYLDMLRLASSGETQQDVLLECTDMDDLLRELRAS